MQFIWVIQNSNQTQAKGQAQESSPNKQTNKQAGVRGKKGIQETVKNPRANEIKRECLEMQVLTLNKTLQGMTERTRLV